MAGRKQKTLKQKIAKVNVDLTRSLKTNGILTTREIALMFSVSESTVSRWASLGKLESEHGPGRMGLMFDAEEARNYTPARAGNPNKIRKPKS